jgi:hypothetical protein
MPRVVNFLFIIVIKHDAIGIAVVDINGPCQGLGFRV